MIQTGASTGRLSVSTVLLTKNNAASLEQYLASMRDIDDIIVLDGGSTDGTQDLLRHAPNVRMFAQPKEFLDLNGYIVDFSGVRNAGYRHAKHRWILCVDADEVATADLLADVRRVVAEGEPGVYCAQRVFYKDGKRVVNFAKSSSDQLRLFHLDVVRGCVRPVHEKLDVLPGAKRGMLHVEVSVPLPLAASVRRKYDRYLAIEVWANAGMPFSRWLRWIFLRNLIAIVRRAAVNLLSYCIPRRGPRYPWSLDWEQIRYSWLLTWRTCPLCPSAHRTPLQSAHP